jgi:hypothetical protein
MALICRKHQAAPQAGCLTCAIVAKENKGTDAAAHAIYHPACSACLRGQPHSEAEHEAKLRRVHASSRGDCGPRMAD